MKDEIVKIKDEIDWKKIDQLHNATSNFSKATIEIKKLLFVVLGITSPIIIGINDNKLSSALFIGIYILIATFWLFDSFNYYYQKKLRDKMSSHFSSIEERNSIKEESKKEESKKKCKILISLKKNENVYRIITSIINPSNLFFYLPLGIINTIVFALN